MKIIARTPTELIIRDSALTLRVFGLFLLGLAAFVLAIGVTQDPGGEVAVVPAVIAAVVALGGLAMIVMPSRKTFAFSKAERVFIIARQRFGRVERQTIPLRDIADVTLEQSRSGDDGDTYRVSVTLADQRRIPWTSYYTSGLAKKRVMVDVVREFLELEPSPRPGSGAVTAKDERDARRGRAGLYLMGAFCSLFLGVGGIMLVKEHRRLTLYQPVTATVLSTRVEVHSDSDGSTYEPVVVYRYRVNEREYTASRVTPLKESRSGGWARRVASRYEVGSEYTAFYDPQDPSEAFLMRSRSIIPWAFVVIPLMGMAFIVAGIRGSYESERLSRWPR